MRTSHNDSVKDPRTTAITINEEALHKEEFEFKSQTKTERALKTLQRLSALTTLLSTYQLIPMTLSLANDPSSFNIISTSLASFSLFLSLGLAYWSTRVLKSEQGRHLLAQELNWEGLNTGLFVTLLMRAALSLVLIPNFLLQSGNTPSHMVDSALTNGQSSQINMARTISNLSVPLPLIELMVFFVFLSAAKTTFSHIKQSGRAMSSLIFFANIAMLSTALGLVFSVLRLKAFPFQGNFALLFPSWNLNGLLRLGAAASFTSFLVWLVNFKRWRVPSVFTTIIVGVLALGFSVLSISGYSNANSVEREHGREFARPYLGFSNLGMLSAVFGMLVFFGGSYFGKRHYNFIETNRKRNLAGFAVLVSFVLIFAAARGFYWQPYNSTRGGFSETKTYSSVEAKAGPQMTIREAMLSQYLLNDLSSLDKGIKDTTKDLNRVITLFENAKRRGFFPKELTSQLWTFTETLENYEVYTPKTATMELYELFGGLDNLYLQLNDASEGVAENSRALRNSATQLWPWSKSLPEDSSNYQAILPQSGAVSKLFSLLGSLNNAQTSIDDARIQLETTKFIYQDALNRATVASAATTELFPWESSAKDLEGYKNILPEDGVSQLWWFFNKVSTVHTKLKEAAQEVRGTSKAIANATTSLWPSREAALSDYRNYVPQEQELQFWDLLGSANDVKGNLNQVSRQLDSALELWSPWANSQKNYKTHDENIPQAVSKLWDVYESLNGAEGPLSDASAKAAKTKASIKEAQEKGALPTEKTVEAWSADWKDNLPSRMVTSTWFSGWHSAEVAETNTPVQENNITQLWGDDWSVVDKLPSFLRLRNAPPQNIWNSDYVTEFPRDAATQLFLWFGKADKVQNAVDAAKAKVQETKDKLVDAKNKGLIYAKNVTNPAVLTEEQLQALWPFYDDVKELKASVNQASQEINDATQGGNFAAATELYPWSDSLNEYNQYKDVLPKIALSELYSFFGSSSEVKEPLANAAQQIQNAKSQGVWNDALAAKLPKDITQLFFGLFNSLNDASTKINEANSKVNSMNNMLSSAQSLGIISKDANVKPTSLEDAASKLNSINNIKTSAQNLGIIKKENETPAATTTTTAKTTATPTTAKTAGNVGGTLNNLQNQLNAANQKVSNIQSIYNNAQNLGLISKPGTATPSQLWTVSGALDSVKTGLNNVNQKAYAAQNIMSNAQSLTRPSELTTLWGSLDEAQKSIANINQELDNVAATEFWWSEALEKSEELEPKTTELISFSQSLNGIQGQINAANTKVSNMKNIYSNAQNLGLVSRNSPSQLFSWEKAVDTVDKYREYLPVEIAATFFAWFDSVSDLTDTIDQTNKQFQEASEKGALPAPDVTETWTADWVDKVPKESAVQLLLTWNALNNIQSSLDTANQKIYNAKNVYQNAQNLGVVSKGNAASGTSQLFGWSGSVQDSIVPSQLYDLWSDLNDAKNSVASANDDLGNIENAYKEDEYETTQLWSLFGWFQSAQSSLTAANQKLSNVQSIYNNAQNLGLAKKQGAASSQLYDFSGSLSSVQNQISTANRKVSNIQSIYSNAQNLGAVSRGGSLTQLWSLFGWFSSAQTSLNSASQKLANIQNIANNAKNLGLTGGNKQASSADADANANTNAKATPAPQTTELFFLWNWITGAQNSLTTANQKLANVQSIYNNAQNLGIIGKQGASTTTTTNNNADAAPAPKTTELVSWFTNSLNSAQSALNTANQKLNNIQSIRNNAQNLGVVSRPGLSTTELLALSSAFNSIQGQINSANQKVSNVRSIYGNAQSLGLVSRQNSPPTTEMFVSFTNALNGIQSSVNTANQKLYNAKSIYSSAQNLAPNELWSASGAFDDAMSKYEEYVPQTVQLWSLFSWLTGAQSSLNTASQKIANIQSIANNAKNLGIIKDGSSSTKPADTTTTNNAKANANPTPAPAPTTELVLSWLGNNINKAQSSLNDANQKLANARSIYNNAQNLGLVGKDNAGTPPPAENTELFFLWNWLTGAQNSLTAANQKLASVKTMYTSAQNLGIVGKDNSGSATKTDTTQPEAKSDANAKTDASATPAPQTTELFFLWNWLTGAQNSLTAANQKLANIQNIANNAKNLGIIKDGSSSTKPADTTAQPTTAQPAPASTTELVNWLQNSLNSAQASLNTANQKLYNAQSIYNNAKNLGLVKENSTPSEMWSASGAFDDSMSKFEEYAPKTTELFFGNWLTGAQNSLNTASQQVASLKNTYTNADSLGKSLGLVNKDGATKTAANSAETPQVTELLEWFTNSLNKVQSSINTANQKVSNMKSGYSNAQNLGLVGTVSPATTPDTTELFFLWNWLTGAQNSLTAANQKLANIQNIANSAKNLGLTGGKQAEAQSASTTTTTTTAAPSELWSPSDAFDNSLNDYEGYVPKTTELVAWLTNSLNSVQASINNANSKLYNIQSIANSAKNIAPSELWSASGAFDDSMSKFEEYAPKTTELFFGNWLTGAQNSLNTANQQVASLKNTYTNAESLGKSLGLVNKDGTTTSTTTEPKLTELVAWFTNTLNGIQSSINTANQKVYSAKSIYNSAQNLAPSELWSASGAFDDSMSKFEEYAPKTTELFFLWNWLTGAQNSLTAANQKLANIQNIANSAKNLGLTGGNQGGAQSAPATTSTTTATPSELWSPSESFDNSLNKYEEYAPKTTELVAWFTNSLNSVQASLNTANQKLNNIQNIANSAKNIAPSELWSASGAFDDSMSKFEEYAPKTTELFFLWNWLTGAQNSLNTANQQVASLKNTYTNAENLGKSLGLVNKDGTTTTTTTTTTTNEPKLTELVAWFTNTLNGIQSSINNANQKVSNVRGIYNNAQNLAPSELWDAAEPSDEEELTRLFWPFTEPKSNYEIAKETVQEKAKQAYDAVSSAANTSQEKLKSAYDISQEKVKGAYDISQEKVKSAYNSVSDSVSSSAAELKQKAEELTNRGEHIKADAEHIKNDSDHVSNDRDAIEGRNQNPNQNQNQAK